MNLKKFAARAGIAAAALIGIASGKVMWSHAYDRSARAQHNSVLADMEARSRRATSDFFHNEQRRAARNAAAEASIAKDKWRRQTVAGLSFEAPFNFNVPPRDAHDQLLTAEAKAKTRWVHIYLPPDAPKEIYVAALAGEYTVAADEESAIAGGVDIMARQLNDKNPEYSVQSRPRGAARSADTARTGPTRGFMRWPAATVFGQSPSAILTPKATATPSSGTRPTASSLAPGLSPLRPPPPPTRPLTPPPTLPVSLSARTAALLPAAKRSPKLSPTNKAGRDPVVHTGMGAGL